MTFFGFFMLNQEHWKIPTINFFLIFQNHAQRIFVAHYAKNSNRRRIFVDVERGRYIKEMELK